MTMTTLELRWAHALFATIFPDRPGSHVRVDLDRLDLAGAFAEAFEASPARVAIGLRLAMIAMALSPLFVIGRFGTLASLPADERERVVSSLASSEHYVVRQLTLLVKAFGALFLLRDAELRASVLAGPARLSQLSRKPVVLEVRDEVA